jgi:alanine racemase
MLSISLPSLSNTIDFPSNAYSCLAINLKNIQDNYLTLSNFLKPAHCSAVLKANAYGLGMEMIGQALYEVGCREFFVAFGDEGAKLRSVVPHDAHIYVLHGFLNNEEKDFHHHQLTPVLNTREKIHQWSRFANKVETNLPCVLHVDTGMTRLGLTQLDVEDLFGAPSFDNLNIHYVMSHLACADDPSNPMNAHQLNLFNTMRTKLPVASASMAASNGMLLGKEYHKNMLRIGAALYGLHSPVYQSNLNLSLGFSVWARVLQVQEINPHQTVGYGQTFRAERVTRIATLGIGYADGYLRNMGNLSFVSIQGIMAPVVGRISMDLITVDVTEVHNPVLTGDWVEVMGNGVHPYCLTSHVYGNNPRELTIYLGGRLKRVYHG